MDSDVLDGKRLRHRLDFDELIVVFAAKLAIPPVKALTETSEEAAAELLAGVEF